MPIRITGQTEQVEARMHGYEDYIYNIENGEGTFEENRVRIIEFLRSQDCGMSLGRGLRLYMCKKYATEIRNENGEIIGFSFNLSDGREVNVSNYIVDGYDVTTDEVAQYTDVFMDINSRYNTDSDGNLVSGINRAEARRLLKVTETVRRDKLFKICFALHLKEEVDEEEVRDFLTKYMCERDYNYRSPEEVIAFYCFSTPEVNSYADFLRIKAEYDRRAEETPVTDTVMTGYTKYAATVFEREIRTEEELYDFLLAHRAEYSLKPQTALREYKRMYDIIERTFELNPGSYDRVARTILEFIPRREDNANEFVSVRNVGDNATNDLPNCIVTNLMVGDRIRDICNGEIAVERKDLVFMRFFLTSIDMRDIDVHDDEYETWARMYNRFIRECNHILSISGFSPLSPLNKYENLILLSLMSNDPFGMFGEIIENSFFVENDSEDSEETAETEDR